MSRDDTFDSLYRRFYKRMIRFFMQFRVSEEDAQDLTSETFMRMYRSLREYRGDAEWAYLEAIARNVLYNNVRARTTQKRGAPTESLSDQVVERADLTNNPDYVAMMARREQQKRLYATIRELPARQRESIRLWLLGYTYEESARVLRTSADAVKSAIRDGKKALHAKLGEATGLPEEDQ